MDSKFREYPLYRCGAFILLLELDPDILYEDASTADTENSDLILADIV